MVNGDVLEMRLITMSAGYDDFSVTQEEGFPPEEMEFRIVQAAEERFPEFQQQFYYDSNGLPAVDLIKNSRIFHRMKFEASL